MINPLKLFSFWATLIYCCLFIFIPSYAPDPIYSWFVMPALILTIGPIGIGLLPNVIIVALIIDIVRRRLPRVFYIIPVFWFGAYYALFSWQELATLSAQAALKAQNKVTIASYDPQKHSLVIPGASGFVGNYKVPIAYSRKEGSFDEYTSYQLLKYEDCRNLVTEINRLAHCKTVSRPMGKRIVGNIDWSVSVLALTGVPEKDILEVRIDELQRKEGLLLRRDYRIYEGRFDIQPPIITNYNFYLQDEAIGTFRMAKKNSYYPLPTIQFRCGFEGRKTRKFDNRKWRCIFKPLRIVTGLNTYPDRPLNLDNENPVGIILGIHRYTKEDISSLISPQLDRDSVRQKIEAEKKNGSAH